jgi:hypothetical protein
MYMYSRLVYLKSEQAELLQLQFYSAATVMLPSTSKKQSHRILHRYDRYSKASSTLESRVSVTAFILSNHSQCL